MVGAIEAAALEDDAGGVDDALHMAGAFGADLNGIVGNLLPGLEAMSAVLATIIICWHKNGMPSS